jgi:hypothetical protein
VEEEAGGRAGDGGGKGRQDAVILNGNGIDRRCIERVGAGAGSGSVNGRGVGSGGRGGGMGGGAVKAAFRRARWQATSG